MKKVIKIKESDLQRIVKRVLTEQDDKVEDYIESTITDRNCIGSGTPTIVVNIFETLTEMMGYSCVGRRDRSNVNDIVLKKSIDCGLATKTLYIMIKTQDFSTLSKVGDLSYYGKGIGEGDTTLREIRGLERKVKESCEKQDNCISYEKFKQWFDGHGYNYKQTPTGMSFIKYCGNVKSVISLTTNPGGCVETISEKLFVYTEDKGVMESGAMVYEELGSYNISLDKILMQIIETVDYGYEKYKQWIEGCSGIFKQNWD